METLPWLLICGELTKPITRAINEIVGLQARVRSAENDKVLLHGITVLGLAYYESHLADVLRYYLRHFPYKLKEGEIKFQKAIFIAEQFDLLERAIDNFITSCAYKNFREFHKAFMDTTSIEPGCDEQDLSTIQELRARRNLLLHNKLIVNDAYQETSGIETFPSKGNRLEIDSEYIHKGFESLLHILKQIQASLEKTYSRYTRIKAVRELWGYCFRSPIMPFEDYWEVDERGDSIPACRISPREDALSGAEKRLLGLWRAQFNGEGGLLKDFNMRLFDRRNQIKILQFLAWNREYLFG